MSGERVTDSRCGLGRRKLFLADLSNSEKKAFLHLAGLMVLADGRVTTEEREMLLDVQEEMDIKVAEESPGTEKDLDELCQSVVLPRARVKILLELASFAFVDHDYDERERELLRAVAKIWQLDDISVVRIEEWAHKRVELAREAAEIIHEVDTFSSLRGEQD